ncbi:MAG: hypothetical protein NVS3B7_09620 [Candidatus Elarobacter sp.]
MDWSWMEGSRAFEIAWGLTAGAICLAVAVPMLWWVLPGHKRSFFGHAIDPAFRLQLAYGIFTMAMAWTNVGCRVIPHDDLPLVHPAFFLVSLALVAGLGPRVVWLLLPRSAARRPHAVEA